VPVTGYGGVDLNVWDYGGLGEPLLFVHCTGTLGRIWDVVVAELGDRFRVLAPDTRGQGDSQAPERRRDYLWDFSGQDLLAIMEHFDLPRGIGAVGHSAGGAHVAYAERRVPGIFGKVMLIDAIIAERKFFHDEHPLAVKVRRRVNEFESLEAARERLQSKPPMEHWVREAVDSYLAHAFTPTEGGGYRLKCPGAREAWYYELGGASDIFDVLDTLQFDARVVTGEYSYVHPWAVAQQARLPKAKLEVVPGAGHFIPQEKPVETAALIAGWFGG
jgi:pimeloyl-ACP methyl ester carboxylesterase